MLHDWRAASARYDSSQHINAKNSGDEHERAGPSLPMPIIVGRDCIGKNLQWERSDGLAEAVIPKTIAESSEKKRSRFAAYASKGEQNPGDDPLGRCLHHDMDNCFPPANTQGERGFAITIRYQQNNLLRCAQDQWNHDQTKREPPGVRREASEAQNDQTVNHDPPGDRRNAVEHINQETENRIEPSRAVFRQINSARNANRYPNDTSKCKQFERADNRIHHATPNGSYRRR